MEFFADGPDGEKVQNVCFLNNTSNADAFHSDNKQFRMGNFHSQVHRRGNWRGGVASVLLKLAFFFLTFFSPQIKFVRININKGSKRKK